MNLFDPMSASVNPCFTSLLVYISSVYSQKEGMSMNSIGSEFYDRMPFMASITHAF